MKMTHKERSCLFLKDCFSWCSILAVVVIALVFVFALHAREARGETAQTTIFIPMATKGLPDVELFHPEEGNELLRERFQEMSKKLQESGMQQAIFRVRTSSTCLLGAVPEGILVGCFLSGRRQGPCRLGPGIFSQESVIEHLAHYRFRCSVRGYTFSQPEFM